MLQKKLSFLKRCGLHTGAVVSIVGAGGKTSLMYHLAQEAKKQGKTCLVTTTTRLNIPTQEQYDQLDLSGDLFNAEKPQVPGVYVAGKDTSKPGKMRGPGGQLLSHCRKFYDYTLIEADGSARKPLKGWKETEPVVADFTSHTIGVIDIQTVGREVSSTLVHRLQLFTNLTGAQPGELVTVEHLVKLINHRRGLFAKGVGQNMVFINKVESQLDLDNGHQLRDSLSSLPVILASVNGGVIHD